MVRRRTILAGAGSSVATAIGLGLISEPTQADQLSVDGLDVPDTSHNTSGSVDAVTIDVNGRYQWETSVTPSKATLRLEIKYNDTWQQIEARDLSDLQPTTESSYSIGGDVFAHSEIDNTKLNPANVGGSKSLTFDVRVRLRLKNDGKDIKTLEATDSATVTVNKTTAQVTGSIGGSGSFEFAEE